MTAPTLDGLTVEQLRDLATRATNTAAAKVKVKEQEDAKQRVKDAKDFVPPVGTEWEYGGRYWVTANLGGLVLSIPKKGGVVRGWWCQERFSDDPPPSHGGWDIGSGDAEPKVIARLALRVRD